MSRTTPTAVQALLQDDYNANPEVGSPPDLQQYIDSASVIVDRVVTDAANLKGITLLASEQELIERWLAAHMYTQGDPTYQSRSTAGASGSFQGQTQLGLMNSRYGQQAMRIDWSQCLRNLDQQQRGKGFWLGTPNC